MFFVYFAEYRSNNLDRLAIHKYIYVQNLFSKHINLINIVACGAKVFVNVLQAVASTYKFCFAKAYIKFFKNMLYDTDLFVLTGDNFLNACCLTLRERKKCYFFFQRNTEHTVLLVLLLSATFNIRYNNYHCSIIYLADNVAIHAFFKRI